MTLDDIEKLCEAATPGSWSWLGYTLGGSPRIWTWTDDPDALAEKRELTNAHPGDLHPLNSGGRNSVLSSTSTGYGGETDVDVSDADARFIAASRTLIPKLLKVARAAKEYVEYINDVDSSNANYALIKEALAELEASNEV